MADKTMASPGKSPRKSPTVVTVQPSSPRFPITTTPTAGAQRKIGIAVDLSDESAYAVQWAVQNYLRSGDAVVLLHVQPTSVLYGADWGAIDLSPQWDPENEESQKKLEDDFDIFTNKKASDVAQPLVEAEIPFKIHIVKDHDMKERLCLEVERLGLSTLIMGSRGFGATKRSSKGRLGSVSDYSVHHCACPVVVVRFPDDKDGEDEKNGENGAESLVESDKLHTVLEVAEEEGDKEEYHDASDKQQHQQAEGDLSKDTLLINQSKRRGMANFGTERVYQEFEPATRWTSEPDAEILVADLPGFKKEQVKVAVTSTRKLRLTGERPTGGNKWIRFHQEIPVPLTVDIDSVSAMFKDYKLYIRHPRIKTETPQTKPPAPVKPPVVAKPHDQHEAKQSHGSKPNDQLKHDAEQKAGKVKSGKEGLTGEPKGTLSSKDHEEKDKVGAIWFEKYKEATGNVVKEAKSKRQLLCNLTASIVLVLLILLYARNAVRSSLVWNSEE